MATPATRADVSRLFGRVAFGATKYDLDVWTGQDYATVVDYLLTPPTPVPVPLTDESARTTLETNQYDVGQAQRWWLERMRTTPFPALERMTLFWHSHFATAYTSAPDVGNMMRQNQTIRTHAFGDFRALLHALTVDGAMLYWLSGFQNRRGAINENHARELFELFTMGTIPQTYTETDIRQAAKALSGWVPKADRTTVFDTNRHDRSSKTIFGTTIGGYPAADAREATEYREVCDLALKQATTARYVAYKLVCSYAYVPDTEDLVGDPDPLVDAVANALRPPDPAAPWDILKAMRTMLLHNGFRYAQRGTGQALVRQPIDLAVHLAKALGASFTTNNAESWIPLYALQRMAQTPFRPPNVAGWPMGTEWLSAVTVQGRYNLGDLFGRLQASQGLNATAVASPLPASGDLAAWAAYLGVAGWSALTTQRVQAYLADPQTGDEKLKQRSVLALLVSSPDWQVL